MRNVLLWLHIGSAVVGFGPTFTFPLWGALAAARGPQNIPLVLTGIRAILNRVVIPLALVVLGTGVALIFVSSFDFFASEWLWIAVLLFAVNFTVGVGAGLPNLNRVLAIFESGQAPERMDELRARSSRQRLLGLIQGLLVLVILGLMVWKPG